MKSIKSFITHLDELIASLKQSENQSSSYFEGLKQKAQDIKTDADLKNFLDGVSKIGAIAQYGDFSPHQGNLLTKLLVEAQSLGNQNP